MRRDRAIAIVGGGLAGLGAACALKAFGMHAEVYEAAPALGEIGAAVNLSPNATKALHAIGLGAKLGEVANPFAGVFTRNMQTGEALAFRDARDATLRYGSPYYSLHRADLLNVLAGSIDQTSIHLGHRLAAIDDSGSAVELTFDNGAVVEAEVVIGADGVRSIVRQALHGDDHPTYTGQMVWRALLRGSEVPPELLEPNGHVQWVGPGRHFIAYYIRGTEIVNIVTQEDTSKWVDESWSQRGDPEEMRRSFPDPEPRLAKLLSLVSECSKWGLFTRPLTENWGRGPIQLIGDAAHAMLPNAGQGAAQAFEDAYILARWLDAEDDPAAAFRNFRRVRIPRVHAVQRLSIANARLKHMRDNTAQKALLESSGSRMQTRHDWLRGYDPVADWATEPTVPEIEAIA